MKKSIWKKCEFHYSEGMITNICQRFLNLIILITVIIGMVGCAAEHNEAFTVTEERLRTYIDTITVVNTHEHQQMREAENFYHIAGGSYLAWDLEGLDQELIEAGKLDEQWDRCSPSLNYNRGTSFYDQLRRGFHILYDFDDLYFTKENIQVLSEKIAENYNDYDRWYHEAFEKAGFEIMFLDQWWDTFNTDIDTRYFALVFRINTIVMAISGRPENIHYASKQFYEIAEEAGYVIQTLDDYLSFSDYLIQQNLDNHAVALKNSLAYARTLEYEYIPYETAKLFFAIAPEKRSEEQKKALEDFMFHWIIEKSIEIDLPVQIHTGYGPDVLEDSRPTKLNNLFIRYPDAKFILFHGGYPWIGEYVALAKRFKNVCLDLVWLPQISREAAVRGIDEMLDCVPYHKIFWGGDCHFIEESAGSLDIGRDVITHVLARRVKRGLMTEDVARDCAVHIFRENAIRVFRLQEKLGREFK